MTDTASHPLADSRPERANARFTPPSHGADRALDVSRRIAELMFGPVAVRDFDVRYWESGAVDRSSTPPEFTLVLKHPATFRAMLLPPSQFRMAQAFATGALDVEGDLIAATAMVVNRSRELLAPAALAHLMELAILLPRPHGAAVPEGRDRHHSWRPIHSQRRDAASIRQHYDLSNDFYRLWLDRRMIYSCAYFDEGVHDIDAAQEAKLEHICRKLRLRAGERLLDIGCGWGGLVIYAAQHFGVRAVGVTLSPAQAGEALGRIHAAGLDNRCDVMVKDYRALDATERFDKIVSVGMCEHVGRAHLGEYFSHVARMLRPGGLFLNHCLTEGVAPDLPWLARRVWHAGAFLDRYIFPDSELPLLEELAHHGRAVGFEARDVEQLREHYVKTVREWLDRLERTKDPALRLVDRWTWRAWRLYLASAAAGLAAGRMELTQIVFARPTVNGEIPGLPATRRDLYQ